MMGSSQQFSLKWTNYTSHITSAFDSLRTKEDFCDVTLSCEGRKIRAHKVLLSACSTYFKEIFKENPCQHPVIIFKNVKYDDLLSIVIYMYQGEVNVEQDALPTFLHTAEMLSIQGLTEDDSTQSERSIIAVPAAPQQQQQVVAATLATHSPQNTITIHGQTIGKTIRDASHISAQKFTLSKPISIIGANTTPVDQIVYTTVSQAPPNSLMQADVLSAKRKRKIVTSQIEKPQTYETQQKTTSQNISTESIELDSYMKAEPETEMATEYAEDDDKNHQTEEGEGDGDMGHYETGSQENDNDDKNDDEYDKPKMATPAELGRLFSSGGTPTPDSKRNSQGGTTDGSTSKWSQCQYCKLVITTVNLWRHIRTQHTAQAPRACEYCNKKFKNKYSLREHVRIAHEQKPGTTTP